MKQSFCAGRVQAHDCVQWWSSRAFLKLRQIRHTHEHYGGCRWVFALSTQTYQFGKIEGRAWRWGLEPAEHSGFVRPIGTWEVGTLNLFVFVLKQLCSTGRIDIEASPLHHFYYFLNDYSWKCILDYTGTHDVFGFYCRVFCTCSRGSLRGRAGSR